MLVPINGFLHDQDPDTGMIAEFCEEVFVAKKHENLLTGDIIVDITLVSQGRNKVFQIERGELSKTSIPRKFFDQGLTMLPVPENCEALLDYLDESDKVAPVAYYHSRLGFFDVDGNLSFLAHTPIGIADPDKATSTFYRPALTAPMGTFTSWKQMVQDEVIGNPYPELALALGVTAPVAYLLGLEKVIDFVPLWALVGFSSSGKTTMQQLMASIYGNPDVTDGLIEDINATENGFFAMLGENQGFPIIVDETTVQPTWDFGNVVYTLPKGKGKKRANKEGKLREVVTFSGAVILSSEKSLLNPSTASPGMYARLVEFTDCPWTNDAAHATRLSQKLARNYGTAVKPLADWLLKNRQKLAVRYELEYQKFVEQLPTRSGIEDRLLKKYALITTSAAVAKKVWNININVGVMRALLLSMHEDNLPAKSVAETAHESILSGVAQNASKFLWKGKYSTSGPISSDIWGEYGTYGRTSQQPCLWITREKFREFVEATGSIIVNRSLLQEMEKHKMIVHFPDNRYCTKHSLGNVSPSCRCLLNLNPPPPVPPPAKTKEQKKEDAERLQELLQEDDPLDDSNEQPIN